jgi:hypothetical protein
MNKSLILLAALLLACIVSKAQTEQGNQNLGLTTALSVQQSSNLNTDQTSLFISTETSKQTTFNFGPHYSYFIANNLDVGVNFSYESTVNTFTNNDPNVEEPEKLSSKNYTGDVFIQKYFLHKNKIGIRVGAYLEYGYENQAILYGAAFPAENSGGDTHYGSIGLRADLVYYPSKHFGLAATLANLQFEHYTQGSGIQGSGSGNSANISFINDGLTLSVFYVFGSKG